MAQNKKERTKIELPYVAFCRVNHMYDKNELRIFEDPNKKLTDRLEKVRINGQPINGWCTYLGLVYSNRIIAHYWSPKIKDERVVLTMSPNQFSAPEWVQEAIKNGAFQRFDSINEVDRAIETKAREISLEKTIRTSTPTLKRLTHMMGLHGSTDYKITYEGPQNERPSEGILQEEDEDPHPRLLAIAC